MQKNLKKFLILALALSLLLCALTLAACDKQNTASYSVTVTCVGGLPEETTVQIKTTDGTLAAESALKGGKATFELEPKDYIVTLSGLNVEQYEFEDGTLDATVTSCEIIVKKLNEYRINATYPETFDVYGVKVDDVCPAAGVKVAMYEGILEDDSLLYLERNHLSPVAEKTTNENGEAIFYLEGDAYTVVFDEYTAGMAIKYPQGVLVNTVTKGSPFARFNAIFEQRYPYGALKDIPLTLQLGNNQIVLSNDILAKTNYVGVYYAFTPDESGNYTFSVTDNADVTGDDGFRLSSGQSKVVSLEAGHKYIFICAPDEGAARTYALNIAKGGTLEGGDIPSSGQTYTISVQGKDANGVIEPIQGVTVTLMDNWNDPSTAVTDAQGKATFANKSVGTFSIRISGYPTYYVDETEEAFSVSKAKPDLVITLTKKTFRHAAVSVKYAEGTMAPAGLLVRLVGENNNVYEAKTSASGVADIQAPDGTYRVEIPIVDSNRDPNGPQTSDGRAFNDYKYNITINGGDVEIEVQYGYLHKVTLDLSGISTDKEIQVQLSDRYGKTYTVKAENGVATLYVLDGEYDVEVAAISDSGSGSTLQPLKQDKLTVAGDDVTKDM